MITVNALLTAWDAADVRFVGGAPRSTEQRHRILALLRQCAFKLIARDPAPSQKDFAERFAPPDTSQVDLFGERLFEAFRRQTVCDQIFAQGAGAASLLTRRWICIISARASVSGVTLPRDTATSPNII